MFLLVIAILVVQSIVVVSENETPPLKTVNCPEYILAGTSVKCKCQKVDSSYTGRVDWYLLSNMTESHITTIDNRDDYSVLEIKPERSLNNQTLNYVCRIDDGSMGLLYQPKIAYGPDAGFLAMTPGNNSDWNFDLCPGETNEMIVFCEVPMENVSPIPGLVFTYSTGGTSDRIKDVSSNVIVIGTTYRFVRSFRPELGEPYYVMCNLTNSAFPQFSQTLTSTVVVREPPRAMPLMTVSNEGKVNTYANGTNAYVKGNSHVVVKCSVKGGTPEVSSVTIVCDINRNTEGGTSAAIEFDTTSTTPTTCTCEASHVSGCYNYKMVVQIAPIYQPSILNFTANGLSDTLEVESGSEVQLVCQAVGSPTPIVSLLRSDKTRLAQVEGLELHMSYMNVQCEVTNRYYCVARNGIETSIILPQKYLDIYVKCLTTLKDPSKQDQKIEVKIGTTASFKVEVKGFPAPTSFVLVLPNSDIDITVDQTKYNVSYRAEIEGIPTSYGSITLHIMDIQKKDLTTYKLLISNGGQLAFRFTLAEAETDNTLYIAIGVSVGVVFLILIIIIVAIICTRKKRKADNNSSPYIDVGNSEIYHTPSPPSVVGDVYTKPGRGPPSIGRSSIASKDLYDTIGPVSLNNEYQDVRKL